VREKSFLGDEKSTVSPISHDRSNTLRIYLRGIRRRRMAWALPNILSAACEFTFHWDPCKENEAASMWTRLVIHWQGGEISSGLRCVAQEMPPPDAACLRDSFRSPPSRWCSSFPAERSPEPDSPNSLNETASSNHRLHDVSQ
jgi:hypothetical protein